MHSLKGFLRGLALFCPVIAFAATQPASKIKVLTDRTESNLKPLFERFEKTRGVKISAVYMDQGLISRLESRPLEADVVITKDAELLEIAHQKKLLQPFKSGHISSYISEQFRDPQDYYFVDAYRARVIIYAKARVKPSQLSTYADLASPKWKGKLCMRSGFHDYNVSLFSQMAASEGLENTRKIIQGLHDNLARTPVGSDRDQAKAIFEGKCDVGLMNTYYFPLMKDDPSQRPWANAVDIFYPDQKAKGSLIMRSALGLTNSKDHVILATSLLEYFASGEGQALTSQATYQFTTNREVPLHKVLQTLGTGQPEVKNGVYKMNILPLKATANNREDVVKILNGVDFDHH